MTKATVIFLLFYSHALTISCQTAFPTGDSVYLFWQAEKRINYGDFKLRSKGVNAAIALWTVLDLPQNTSLLSPKQMKVYIAPVCDRFRSYADTNDLNKIAIHTILFDILELWARSARIKIDQLPDSIMSAEALSGAFKTIVREMHENRLRMNRKFHREVIRDKKENALQAWQEMLKRELSSTAKWITQPSDCYRFLQNHPLEQGYVEDLSSNAVLIDTLERVLAPDTWHGGFYQISRLQK